MRSDNGSEFICLREFFAAQGIIHQTSCVETPQQNGRVERKHRHILNIARALLLQGNLPKQFWGESILAATYLLNRTPSRILHNKTPYEMLHGQSPTYEHIRVFGTLCYAQRIARGKDKFDERSTRCVFLGYPMGKKGWVVCDLETENFFVSRDVEFHEDMFPFTTTKTSTTTDDSLPVQLSTHPATFDDDFDPFHSTEILETGGVLNTPANNDPAALDTTTEPISPTIAEPHTSGEPR